MTRDLVFLFSDPSILYEIASAETAGGGCRAEVLYVTTGHHVIDGSPAPTNPSKAMGDE